LRAKAGRGEAGFTLIEVVVALALLGLVLALLAGSLRNGLVGASRAAAITPPLAVAEAKLAAIGVTEPLIAGDTSGEDASGVRWRVSVADYDDEGSAASEAPGVPRLYRVTVTATWTQGGAPRSLSLDTLRLAVRRP